jgi:predicted RNase H-like HicB family nuclease
MPSYIALIHKDPTSDYGVSFPDLPGCVSAGATLDEARAMAAEALAFHAEGMAEDGEALPPPSTLEAIMADRINHDAVAILVDLPKQSGRSVRINITLPEAVLEEIDRFVAKNGLTRSGFLARVASKELDPSNS